jgi:hypothetical protein
MAMSRIALVTLAFMFAPVHAAAGTDGAAKYQQLTSVTIRCSTPASGNEIRVCGRRQADRWRVPFVGYEAGDPRGETVEGERKRISAAPRVPCGRGAIIADCGGGVGIKAAIGLGPGGEALRLRPLAD